MAHSQEVLDLIAKRQEINARLDALREESVAAKKAFDAALRKERIMDKVGEMSDDEKEALKKMLAT